MIDKRVKFYNFGSLLIVILGLLQAVSMWAGDYDLARLAKASAASPLPTPFKDSRGYENFSAVRTYIVKYTDETSEKLDIEELYSNFSGPHRRKIVYMQSLIWAPRLSVKLRDSALQGLFCGNQFIDINDFNQNDKIINRVDIDIRQKTAGREFYKSSVSVMCQ